MISTTLFYGTEGVYKKNSYPLPNWTGASGSQAMHLQVCGSYGGNVEHGVGVSCFSWQNFGFFATVALSFLFDKHCLITE